MVIMNQCFFSCIFALDLDLELNYDCDLDFELNLNHAHLQNMGRQAERSDIGAKKGKGKKRMAVQNSIRVADKISKKALKGDDPVARKTTSRSRKRFAKRSRLAEEKLELISKLEDEGSAEGSDDLPDDDFGDEDNDSKKLQLFDGEIDDGGGGIGGQDDEEEEAGDDDDEYDEDGDSSDSNESIATKSKNILKQDANVRCQAEKELRLNIAQDNEYSDDEPMETMSVPTDLKSLKAQISARLDLLNNSKAFEKYQKKLLSVNEEPLRRSDLIRKVQQDLQSLYSYNDFLVEALMDLFTPKSILQFMEASESERPLTIRTNTLKTRRKDLAQCLINRGVNLDPLGPWTKVGLVIYRSQVPIGATPEYLAGHYVIQGASSMLPVIALAPKSDEKVLDLCAAPGMKTSYIAQLMKNTGMVLANDPNENRCKAIVGNLHRTGVSNTVICSLDGRKMPHFYRSHFDRVLVDAPCSGSGVISKDTSVKSSKDALQLQRIFTVQRELLLAAIDSCSSASESGGFIVYSTCSVLVEENEAVVDYALKHRHVVVVPIAGFDIGEEGFAKYKSHRFHPSLKLSKRFYPHLHNMDGFFICKLRKKKEGVKTAFAEESDEEPQVNKKSKNSFNDKNDNFTPDSPSLKKTKNYEKAFPEQETTPARKKTKKEMSQRIEEQPEVQQKEDIEKVDHVKQKSRKLKKVFSARKV